MKKIIKQLLSLILLATASANAQVNIGATAPAHASSQLEVTSTQKGLLPPRMTQAQRNAIVAPAAGLVVYNTTEKCLNFYNGNGWASFCDGKVDAATRLINYRLGGSGNDVANSIQQTSDGGYIVAGYTASSASGDVTGTTKGGTDVWVVKLTASGAISWQKNYGGSGYDYASSIQQTSDGGYIVVATTSSSNSGDVTGTSNGLDDVWVVKLTASGAISWQKNYGGSGIDEAKSIQQTSDGGYIMAGYTNSSASGDMTGTNKGGSDVWVLKLNASGNITWEKNYGGSGNDSANSVQQTSDGGYIVAGSTNSSASGDVSGTTKGGNDVWVVKLTALGGISWQKNCGGSLLDLAHYIQQTSDGGYIVAVRTLSSASGDMIGTNKGGYDVWVVKLTAAGAISWQKNYGGSGNDIALSIQQTSDGNYVVAGYSADASAGNGDLAGLSSRGSDDVWVFAIDENGAILAP